MEIRWHGHACFAIRNDVCVVTDPHDGRSIGIRPPRVTADVVLVSHDHFDHNSVRSVEGPNTRVITGNVGTRVEHGVKIRSFLTYHDAAEGTKRGENTIYLFVMEGIRLCHLGDLGHTLDPKFAGKLGAVDILFIPVGDIFTIGPKQAWSVIEVLNPKVIIPMHYRVGGLSLSIQSVEPFLSDAKKVMKVGNEINFDSEDMEEEGQVVWVFSL